MPKFEVTVKEIEIYILEVEADSEDLAREKAYIILDGEDADKAVYHNDSDSEAHVQDAD